MTITDALASLEATRKLLQTCVSDDAAEQWREVQSTLNRLDQEARWRELPWGVIGQKTTSLRHNFGVLIGKKRSDGHPRIQHLAWVLGDLQALRSDHCFGPVLDREAAGAVREKVD